jgi:hypothetical protein
MFYWTTEHRINHNSVSLVWSASVGFARPLHGLARSLVRSALSLVGLT